MARPTAPDGRPLAEFVDRFLARLIDGAIMTVVGLLIMIPMIVAMVAIINNATSGATVNPDGTISDEDTAAVVLPILGIYASIFLIIFALSWVYEVELPLRKSGQTFGKRAMKITVVPLHPGTPMTRGVLGKRWLIQVGSGFFFVLQWLDGLWQLWDKPFRQCLHDKFAKTVVVKVGP